MNAAFDRAAIYKPFYVLGRKLRPFSIGHEILLSASGNAFAKISKENANFADLALAVRICRLDYNAAIEDMMGGNLRFKLWLWFLKHARIVPELEILKFRAYLNHYRSGPEFTRKGDVARSVTGAPFEYVLKIFLCTKMGLSVDAALNYPFCSAVADFLTYLETKGAIFIVDSLAELEREAIESQAEIIEKSKQMGAATWQ